jgi:hypothetical protein
MYWALIGWSRFRGLLIPKQKKHVPPLKLLGNNRHKTKNVITFFLADFIIHARAYPYPTVVNW